MRSTLPRSVDGYGVTPRDGDKKEAFFVFRLKSTLVEKRGENRTRNIIYYYYYRCEISNEIITYWNKNLSYFSFLFLFFLFFLRKQFCFYLISRDNDNDKILNFLKLRMNSRIGIINSYILWFFS